MTVKPLQSGAGTDLQQQLADKLWHTLFGGADMPLLAPWQLRAGQKSHQRVREAELEAIRDMLQELDELHAGRKIFNRLGEIVAAADAQLLASIRFNPVIEQAEADPLETLRVPGTAEALAAVRLEADIQALRRSLNVRRIGLRADMLAETWPLQALSERAVDADWLLRWRDCAAHAVAEDFQELWARVLINEVCKPGRHSVRTLVFLSSLSRADMSTIRFMSRLDLGGFVCRDAADYFQRDIHGPMFAQMEEMGLLARAPELLTVKSVSPDKFRAVLRGLDKALYIEGEGPELVLSTRPFTPLGREVLGLFSARADTGYLFALGHVLKQRGLHIDIGDWSAESGEQGFFSEKMSL